MSIVHFVGGEKGGVGKSVVARLLTQLFIDRSWPFVAFDADLSHGALLRYYADYTQPVDLAQLASADQIMDAAVAGRRGVIVDLPAQSQRALQRWLDSTDVLEYAREAGVRLVSWHVTDGGFDSVSQLEQQLARHGDALHYVVVKNEGRSKNFRQFDASAANQRVRELGGQVITLPELDSAVMYEIDRFGSSFWAAIHASEGPRALPPMARRRAKQWLERAQAALDAGGSWQPQAEPVAAATAARSTDGANETVGVN
ncbi:MAG TPA: hypothetical protein VMG12_12125 [Polyangiaceae bacterium]|nr:hypothetical protein [Polyangiaceae bacterium]